MNGRLPDLMEVASREARDRVVPADLAAAAWRAGRARRRAARRRTAASVVAAVVALVAVGTGVGALRLASAPAPTAPLHLSGTYPERITGLGSTEPLPARPGRLAGLAERYLPETEGVLWTAITPGGLSWTIESDGTPALSPDGRTLVTLRLSDGRITVHDLVAGTSRPVTGIRPVPHQETRFDAWSPDGSTLVLRTPHDGKHRTYHLLDVATARATPGPAVLGSVVGVDDDDTVTVLRTTAQATDVRGPTGTLTRIATDGRLIAGTPLDTRQVSTGARMWAETAALSPDGTRLALIDPGGRNDDGEARPPAVLVFAADDGHLVSHAIVDDLVVVNTALRLAWVGDDPVVLDRTGDGPAVSALVVRPAGAQRLVAVDPDLLLTQLIWASDALRGDPVPARFGTTQAWWSWHPRTFGVVGGLVLLAGLLVVVGLVRRARR